MKNVYYISVIGSKYDFEEARDIVDYFVYKDSVFTTKKEAHKMLEIAKSDKDNYNRYDEVYFEVMQFWVNPLSQNIDIYE